MILGVHDLLIHHFIQKATKFNPAFSIIGLHASLPAKYSAD
jgi:hypothetical protein